MKDTPALVRLRPTKDNLALMVDMFCAMIEARSLPVINSPAHHAARWLVNDSGLKSKRRRTRLKHRKPNTFSDRA